MYFLGYKQFHGRIIITNLTHQDNDSYGSSGSAVSLRGLPRSAENAPETGRYGRKLLVAVGNRPISAASLVAGSCQMWSKRLLAWKPFSDLTIRT